MGSFVSVGFVYDKKNYKEIKIELMKLVNLLVSKRGKVKGLKMSKDIDGEEWIEESEVEYSQVDMLTEYYYGELNLSCSIIRDETMELVIRIEKEDDYFGFLLDLCESDLYKTDLNYITQRLIDFIVEFYVISTFDYAFCDNEAQIEYSPKDFRELNRDKYSIVAIPKAQTQDKSLRIIKSNWNIDGLTKRT